MTLIAESLQGVGDAVLNLHSGVTLQGAVLAIFQDCHHSTAVVFLVHNHVHSLCPWTERKAREGMHFTRCPCSVQTSEDTKADPNETQDTCTGGEKERSCVRNPM